jgi:hypothetical protein
VRIRIIALFVLAVASMFAPSAAMHFMPRAYTRWAPPVDLTSEVAPLFVTVIWSLVFLNTYRAAGVHKEKVLWLLLLAPFVLCYPGWLIVLFLCGFFNWCGGPPL